MAFRSPWDIRKFQSPLPISLLSCLFVPPPKRRDRITSCGFSHNQDNHTRLIPTCGCQSKGEDLPPAHMTRIEFHSMQAWHMSLLQ